MSDQVPQPRSAALRATIIVVLTICAAVAIVVLGDGAHLHHPELSAR